MNENFTAEGTLAEIAKSGKGVIRHAARVVCRVALPIWKQEEIDWTTFRLLDGATPGESRDMDSLDEVMKVARLRGLGRNSKI